VHYKSLSVIFYTFYHFIGSYAKKSIVYLIKKRASLGELASSFPIKLYNSNPLSHKYQIPLLNPINLNQPINTIPKPLRNPSQGISPYNSIMLLLRACPAVATIIKHPTKTPLKISLNHSSMIIIVHIFNLYLKYFKYIPCM
jgi:hypothetical protein